MRLTFIPTPSLPDRDLLKRDLHTYHRRLKILDYFDYNTDYTHLPFTTLSSWEPTTESISTPIRHLIHRDTRALSHLQPRRRTNEHNITPDQQLALKSLSARHEIIIKPADKGGQIVIQDRTNYILEATRQLNDLTYYHPLDHPLYPETQHIITDRIGQMKIQHLITAKQARYLLGPDTPRPRLFYLLPKIHKPPATWTVPFVVPLGRPIVSDCGSESYRFAEFIHHYINPLSHNHPSYIKDTYTFVNKLKHLTVPSHTFIFSIDVNSLYTNISTPLGLDSARRALQAAPDPTRPDHFILKFLELTLTRNDFQFYDHLFLQVCGCAMGRKYSPAYADIYLADWEQFAFHKCVTRPLVYLRYLDDIFGLWDGSEASFIQFFTILNTHHPQIKLKYTTSTDQIPFLDTVVFFTDAGGGTEIIIHQGLL